MRPLALLSTVARVAGAYALPPRCPGCGAVVDGDHRFCIVCWQQLDFLGGPACVQCAEPFEIDPGAGARCGACLADPPAFDTAAAAVAYGPIARALALKLKYGGRPGIAKTIAASMARLAGEDGGALVAPVPLHRWRIWRRGYNQSQLIAHALVARAGGELVPDLLERRRATPVLRGLGPAARTKAVRGAFAVAERHRARLRGRRVLLIDDVFTTGATADACARTLKRAGAAEVRLLCWARVMREGGGGVDNRVA